MRAGKLKTRRYKVRRHGRGWLFLLLLAAAAVIWFYQAGRLPLPLLLSPAPGLTPEEGQRDERTVSLPGGVWYALQLGAFPQEEPAKALSDSYRARGAGGYILGKYQVLAAAYASRADAQAVQSQLRALHSVETVVTEISWPEITLHLTGQRAQLTALTDAWDALSKAAEHLSSLSRSLDNREKDAAAVRAALSSETDTLSALQRQLESRFGGSAPGPVRDVISQLSRLSAALREALSARSETLLGAQVKYSQLLCLDGLAAYAATLAP